MLGLTPRRYCRQILMLLLVALAIYVPINVFFTISGSVHSDNPPKIIYNTKNKKSDTIDVKVSQVKPGSEPGKVDLVLSVDVDDLIRLVDNLAIPEGEMTANPLPSNFSVILHNPNICKLDDLEWVVYVHSSPANAERRMNIRRTWADVGLFKRRRFVVVFLIGQPDGDDAELQQKVVEEEFSTYGDIVQGDFLDNYKNLTLKGILGLKWVSMNCNNAAFAIKADDDAFVNIFEVLKIMERTRDKKFHITCPLWKDNSMPILRDPTKCMKWCVKRTEFPGRKYFPKYCAGLAYILSQKVMSEMHKASYSTPFFWIDDVYVTGLLPRKVKDVTYTDLLRNFTLKEVVAMEMYDDFSKDVTVYFIHIKNPANFDIFWRLTLQRLHPSQLALLSDKVLDQFALLNLRDKVSSFEKMRATTSRVLT